MPLHSFLLCLSHVWDGSFCRSCVQNFAVRFIVPVVCCVSANRKCAMRSFANVRPSRVAASIDARRYYITHLAVFVVNTSKNSSFVVHTASLALGCKSLAFSVGFLIIDK